MRPWMRKLGWFGAGVLAIGLAWWGWHLPPAPKCELEGSTGCEVIGYSEDGKWFAARTPADEANEKPPWTYLWNARTGEKAQSLPPSYVITPHDRNHQHHNLATWHTIDLPSQHYGVHHSTFEYTDDGLTLVPMEQPIEFWPLLKDGNTYVWVDGDRRLWHLCQRTHLKTLAGLLPHHWYWMNLAGQGRTLICRGLRSAEVCLWDVQHGRLHAEYHQVDAASISDDGSFAAIALGDAIEIWNLRELSKERIELPAYGGWEKDGLELNDAILISRNGRRLVAPMCGSLQDFFVVDVAEPLRIRRLHLPEPVAEHSVNRWWWFDATGDYLFVNNENGEKTCWYLGGDCPRLVARFRFWSIQVSAQPEPLSNTGWLVGYRTNQKGGDNLGGGCIFGTPATTFLGGAGPMGALGFTGGTQQTGLGFGGGDRTSFCPDSRWAIRDQQTYTSPQPFLQWFQYFSIPVQMHTTYGTESELLSLTEWKILGAWADTNCTTFSPDGKYIAVQTRDGPITIWDLPPKQRWFVPLLLQIPMIGILWHCRPKWLRR